MKEFSKNTDSIEREADMYNIRLNTEYRSKKHHILYLTITY